jgi:formylglycine-generating enzyme required for sulfatase activity
VWDGPGGRSLDELESVWEAGLTAAQEEHRKGNLRAAQEHREAAGQMSELITQLKERHWDAESPLEVTGPAGITLIWVPGGSFRMGSSSDGEADEKPVHRVELAGFWISRTEVTVAQWRSVMGRVPEGNVGNDDHPVVCVSWSDCVEFCRKAGLNLPTEAQWEYAARGPESLRYPWGNEGSQFLTTRMWQCRFIREAMDRGDHAKTRRLISELGKIDTILGVNANAVGDLPSQLLGPREILVLQMDKAITAGDPAAMEQVQSQWCAMRTVSVGSAQADASWCGALDMAGSVMEWCADWYDEGYYGWSPARDPTGPPRGRDHVVRGGSWLNNSRRAGDREIGVVRGQSYGGPGLFVEGHDATGFRVARSVRQ